MKVSLFSLLIVPSLASKDSVRYANGSAPILLPIENRLPGFDVFACNDWTTALTPNAKKIAKMLVHKGSVVQDNYPAQLGQASCNSVESYMKDGTGIEVGPDSGTVQTGNHPVPIYFRNFETFVAVAMRGESFDGNVTLGLHHISRNPSAVEATLKKVADAVKRGKIRIFIAERKKKELLDGIEQFQIGNEGKISVDIRYAPFNVYRGAYWFVSTNDGKVNRLGVFDLAWVSVSREGIRQCIDISIPAEIRVKKKDRLIIEKE